MNNDSKQKCPVCGKEFSEGFRYYDIDVCGFGCSISLANSENHACRKSKNQNKKTLCEIQEDLVKKGILDIDLLLKERQ